jgi:hypothetical protein
MKAACMAVTMTALATMLWGCNPRLRVDPITVEPIKVDVDVNVRLDERLDQFFAFEEDVPVEESEDPGAGVTVGDTAVARNFMEVP